MYKNKFKKAFTMIELLITISIISVIAGIFLANYYGGETQSQIINGVQILMKDLRLVQSKSISAYRYGSENINKWGIQVNRASSSYLIYADLNDNDLYDVGEALKIRGGQEVDLPDGVEISYIDAGILQENMDITFSNKNNLPEVFFANNLSYFSGPIKIDLKETVSGVIKSVYVNRYGLIYSDL